MLLKMATVLPSKYVGLLLYVMQIVAGLNQILAYLPPVADKNPHKLQPQQDD